jgi:outer membrane lipoprotein SlyB
MATLFSRDRAREVLQPHHSIVSLGSMPYDHSGRWVLQRQAPSCTTQAVNATIRGAVIGSIWGAGFGSYNAWQYGLRGQEMMKFAGKNTINNAGSFAVFLGLFSGIHCASERVRGVRDWQNATVAGAVSGAVVSAPQAYMTKNPRYMLMTSALTAAITTGLSMLNYL